jgi:hypothetical protein
MDHQGVDRASGGMRFRKLRIAWTAFFAALAVAFVVLWVASISHVIFINFPAIKNHCITAYPIRNALVVCDEGNRRPNRPAGIEISSPPSYWPAAESQVIQHGPFVEYPSLIGTAYGVSFWLLIILSSSLAPLSWLHWRFSLRTILIATTLVAVVLGLVVWAARK